MELTNYHSHIFRTVQYLHRIKTPKTQNTSAFSIHQQIVSGEVVKTRSNCQNVGVP